MNKLNKFYEHILRAFGMEADDEGLISRKAMGPDMPSRPAAIDGERLCLPTSSFLQRESIEGLLAFHPLSENIANGQSKVQKYLRNTARTTITYYVAMLTEELIKVVCNKEYQSRLPSTWNDFFKSVVNVDDKTEKNLTKAINESLGRKTGIVSLFLKNGGKLDDVDYLRTCNISFPIVGEVEGRTPYGVTLRKKDVEVLLNILTYILPGIRTEHHYSAGVDYGTAPYFSALMTGYANVFTDINKCIDRMVPLGLDVQPVDLSYMMDMGALGALRKLVPPQPGNEGTPNKAKVEEEEEESKDAPPWDEKEERGSRRSTRDTESESRSSRRAEPEERTTRRREPERSGGVSFSEVLNRRDRYEEDERDDRRYGRDSRSSRRSSRDRRGTRDRRDDRRSTRSTTSRSGGGVSINDVLGRGRRR